MIMIHDDDIYEDIFIHASDEKALSATPRYCPFISIYKYVLRKKCDLVGHE